MITQTQAARPGRGGAAETPRNETTYHGDSITLADLIALEPRILSLLTEASMHSPLCAYCRFYARRSDEGLIPGFKSHVIRLTGWVARTDNATLRTSRAYDLLYHAVWRVMRDPPVCRRCGDLEGGDE